MRDGTESADTATRAGLATANCHMTGPATLPEVSATVTATVCTPGPRFPGAQTKRPDAKLPPGRDVGAVHGHAQRVVVHARTLVADREPDRRRPHHRGSR